MKYQRGLSSQTPACDVLIVRLSGEGLQTPEYRK